MIQCLNRISESREKIEIFGDRYLVGETKLILVFSGIIFAFMILLISFSGLNIIHFVIGVLLVLIIAFVTKLMFDMDDLSYGDFSMREDNINSLIKEIKSR